MRLVFIGAHICFTYGKPWTWDRVHCDHRVLRAPPADPVLRFSLTLKLSVKAATGQRLLECAVKCEIHTIWKC